MMGHFISVLAMYRMAQKTLDVNILPVVSYDCMGVQLYPTVRLLT